MRILVVTTWFPTASHPAVGAFVARDVAALATEHDVRVLHLVAPHLADDGVPLASSAEGGDPEDRDRVVLDLPGMERVAVPVRRLVTDLRRPDHLLRAGRAIRELSRGADVLHTSVFSTLLALAGRRVDLPWVHTEHWQGVTSTAEDSPFVRAITPPLRALLRRPDVVTAVSEMATAPVRALRGERRTVVVPCVVAPVEPLPPRRDPDGELRLVAVAGLVPRKRPVLAIEAVAALQDVGVDVELTWVGDGEQRAEVEARAAALGVRVRLTGAVEAHIVSAELARADLFFLPTRRETFGVAIAEALAHGLPVVTGDDVGVLDFADPLASTFVTGEDPAAWARAVLEVRERTAGLSREQVAASLGSEVRPEQVRAAYESIYASVLVTPRGSADASSGSGSPLVADASAGLDLVASPEVSANPGPAVTAPPWSPQVDVVVAVHTESRPVARAVSSVLANHAPVRVTVVCHHVPAERIAAALGDLPERARTAGHEVRLVEHADGVPSPAGPFNKGLDLAEAPYVALLGSDDRFAPGALDSWLALAAATDADAVIARLVYARPDGTERAAVPTPPTRPWRTRRLDPVRDRLAYRSAPLGLLRRATLERLGLRHVEGRPVGEDLELSTHLWFAGERIAFDRRGPAYLIGEDGTDRVTMAPRSLARDLLWLPDLLDARWFRSLPVTHRRAIGVKILRIHLFGAIHYRATPHVWTAEERELLRELTAAVLAAAPDVERVLSHAERDLLDAALDPGIGADVLIALSARRRRHGTPATLVPRDVRYLLAREAPLRMMAASALARI